MSARPRRRGVAVVVVIAALTAGAAAGFALTRPEPAAATAAPPVTAAVERTTLVAELRLVGTLAYGDPEPLPPVDGVITVLPSPGDLVSAGEQVVEVDGAPVVLFTGERPFWRELSTDSSRGADILQLEENLHAFGFLARTPQDRFDWRTRQAVRDFQRGRGVEETGVFSPSDVVVIDQPALRIEQVTARLGEEGVSPATFTGTNLQVTAGLTEAQARELVPGTGVEVELQDLTRLPGTVVEVDPGGQIGDDGNAAPATAVVGVDPALLAGAAPGPVRVIVRDDADVPVTLVVPANALLATADGGYAVEVWDGTSIRRVPVLLGAVADARVQIVGGDLDEGDQVVLAR